MAGSAGRCNESSSLSPECRGEGVRADFCLRATMHSILAEAGAFETIKHVVNAATKPQYFLTISFIVFILMFALYKIWTKPIIFALIFGLFLFGYFGSMQDENYRRIVAKPDNVPIS